jgi:hypothetical protein
MHNTRWEFVGKSSKFSVLNENDPIAGQQEFFNPPIGTHLNNREGQIGSSIRQKKFKFITASSLSSQRPVILIS